MDAQQKAPRAPFPQVPEEFEVDDRVSYSKLSNKFILEAEDGQEYEYDDSLKRWVAVVRSFYSHTEKGLPARR